MACSAYDAGIRNDDGRDMALKERASGEGVENMADQLLGQTGRHGLVSEEQCTTPLLSAYFWHRLAQDHVLRSSLLQGWHFDK